MRKTGAGGRRRCVDGKGLGVGENGDGSQARASQALVEL